MPKANVLSKTEAMRILIFVLLASLSVNHLLAEEFSNETASERDFEEIFSPNSHEASFGGGVFFSPFIATKGRPAINYAAGVADVGWMLTDLNDAGLWRGNFEILGEGFAGGIFHGRGSYIANASLFLRYNVAVPQWKLAPYIQAGAGVSMLDIDRQIFGQSFNFGLSGGIGTRYFLTKNTSVNVEGRFQHFSNAGMSRHNLGINAQGVVLSVSRFF